jgi:hypothetical protein
MPSIRNQLAPANAAVPFLNLTALDFLSLSSFAAPSHHQTIQHNHLHHRLKLKERVSMYRDKVAKDI